MPTLPELALTLQHGTGEEPGQYNTQIPCLQDAEEREKNSRLQLSKSILVHLLQQVPKVYFQFLNVAVVVVGFYSFCRTPSCFPTCHSVTWLLVRLLLL